MSCRFAAFVFELSEREAPNKFVELLLFHVAAVELFKYLNIDQLLDACWTSSFVHGSAVSVLTVDCGPTP